MPPLIVAEALPVLAPLHVTLILLVVKDKAVGDRLQFIPSTKIPIIGKKHFES